MKYLKNLMNKLGSKFNLRELVLIGALLFMALIYIYLEFVVFPLSAEIEAKEGESAVLTEELIQKRTTASRLPKLEEEYHLLQGNLLKQRLSFYPTENQEFVINTLEDMVLADDKLSAPSIDFSEANVAEELAEGLYRTSVTFNYVSDYDSIKAIVARLEAENEKVNITNMIMLEDRLNDQYSGSVTINFYSVPRPFEYEWSTQILARDDVRVVNQNIFHRDPSLWQELDKEETGSSPVTIMPEGETDGNTDNSDQDSDSEANDQPTNDNTVDYFDEVIHVVEEGETFEDLSLMYYGKSYYDIFLKEMNNYGVDEEPKVGDELVIPGVMYLRDK